MFGAFKSTMSLSGGYLWKKAPRLSQPQKYRLRKRMQMVDANIEAIYSGVIALQGKQQGDATGLSKVDFLKFDMPKENELTPRDKYTAFDKKVKNYRKDLHLVPKWTKKTFRVFPKYF
ncbi:large ribosomal subunit protein mL60 [Diutina catenulata]